MFSVLLSLPLFVVGGLFHPVFGIGLAVAGIVVLRSWFSRVSATVTGGSVVVKGFFRDHNLPVAELFGFSLTYLGSWNMTVVDLLGDLGHRVRAYGYTFHGEPNGNSAEEQAIVSQLKAAGLLRR